MNSRNYLLFQQCFRISILFTFFISGTAEITVSPNDTEAAVGDDAIIFCSSTSGSCEWYHQPVGAIAQELLYRGGFIYNGYRNRFSVTKTTDNACNLLIKDVRIEDAGMFLCMEVLTGQSQKTAEFIVFEYYPSNKTCFAKITCAPICNDLELTCGMKPYGNLKPVMEWRNTAGHLVNSTSGQDKSTSVVHLKDDSLQSPIYTCQVRFPTESLSSKYLWSYSTSSASLGHTTAAVPVITEQPQQETVPSGLIVIVIAAFIFLLLLSCVIVFLSVYIRRIKRKFVYSANTATISAGQLENGRPKDIGNDLVSENSILLADTEDGRKTGFVPRTSHNKNKAIRGLGVLDDEVFVSTRGSCVIEVFDLHSAKYKRAWKIEGMIDPNDMATSPANGLIFICDWKKAGEDKEIFCVDKYGHLKSKWISENERGRISVTKECDVIVAESWYNTIREYTWSGQLIKKLDIPRQKLHLWHAIKLDSGHFVASFGDIDDEIQEICEIDSKGNVLHSITKNSLSLSGVQLSVPRSLAVDKDGNIYVCDLYNGRIIVLTSELEYKGIYDTTEDGEHLRGPLRVCVYESGLQRHLLVADCLKEKGKCSDGRILAWNLSSGSNK